MRYHLPEIVADHASSALRQKRERDDQNPIHAPPLLVVLVR